MIFLTRPNEVANYSVPSDINRIAQEEVYAIPIRLYVPSLSCSIAALLGHSMQTNWKNTKWYQLPLTTKKKTSPTATTGRLGE